MVLVYNNDFQCCEKKINNRPWNSQPVSSRYNNENRRFFKVFLGVGGEGGGGTTQRPPHLAVFDSVFFQTGTGDSLYIYSNTTPAQHRWKPRSVLNQLLSDTWGTDRIHWTDLIPGLFIRIIVHLILNSVTYTHTDSFIHHLFWDPSSLLYFSN